MDKKLQGAFNEQLNKELYSGYLYLSIAAYFEAKNLEGFSHWMKIQAKEEIGHAMKFFDFINDRNERVILEAVNQPPKDFLSVQDVFEKALEHEKKMTSCINQLCDLSKELNDYPCDVFLQWFVSEQVEEEKSVLKILECLKIIKPDSAALIMLDRELGGRKG